MRDRKPKRGNRGAWLCVRLTPAEHKAIAAKAATTGNTVSGWVRFILAGASGD